MSIQVTEAEWKILEVLWQSAPRTIAQITKALHQATGWSRHVVITLLKRMEEKGTVEADLSDKVKRYNPKVNQKEATIQQTDKFLSHVFGGNASLLVSQLVDTGELTQEDLEEILKVFQKGKS
jgi:BlaI family penicillinase repressor